MSALTGSDKSIAAIVAATGGAAALYMLTKSRKPAVKEPPSKLHVYGFVPLPPDADSSPACLKLLTFLKMTKTNFVYVPFSEHDMKGSPKGKMPWAHGVVLGSENPVGDSEIIIDALVRANPSKYDLDTHLSNEGRAIGTAFAAMLEESCYFSMMHVRLNTDEFDRCTAPLYFSSVPTIFRGYVQRSVRKKLLRDLSGQGTGLLDDEEVIAKAKKEIEAISVFLGKKKYLFGESPSSFDATAFAYLCCMVQGDWRHPICDIARMYHNIVEYVDRMRKEFWPELQG